MNLKLLFSMLLLIIFSACSNQMDEDFNNLNEDENAGKLRLYGVKTVDEPQTKGTAQRSKLWYHGSTIKIKFLDGTTAMQNEVKAIASEWLVYAGINFSYVTSGDADVRIAFDKNVDRYVTWSYTGTDCKKITNQNEATMNIAFWNELTASEKKGDVLRAFGQMLGLELEHRHLKLNPTWGSRIEGYWTDELGDIPWETLRKYVFDPIGTTDVIATNDYDPQSIMIWPFVLRGLVTYPAGYEVPKVSNTELSALDKELIASIYPPIVTDDDKNDPDYRAGYGLPTVFTFLNRSDLPYERYDNYYWFAWMLKSDQDIIVDFGNNEIYRGPAKDVPSKESTRQRPELIVKVWAKDLGIYSRNGSSILTLYRVHFSPQTKYNYINFASSTLTEVTYKRSPDFSEVTTISFSECPHLKTIPTGLFNKTKSDIIWSGAFNNCKSLTSIPADIFSRQTKSAFFSMIFRGCTSLKTVPAGLFDNNTEAKYLDELFSGCTSLQSVPADLFSKLSDPKNFRRAFNNCSSLTNYIPLWQMFPSATGYYCYEGCPSSITQNIPSDWK